MREIFAEGEFVSDKDVAEEDRAHRQVTCAIEATVLTTVQLLVVLMGKLASMEPAFEPIP